jgi:TPR repeat protein
MLTKGQGVATDFNEALDWFGRAEEHGVAEARAAREVIQDATHGNQARIPRER